MNREKRNHVITFILVFLVSTIFIMVGSKICKPEYETHDNELFYTARVVAVGETEYESFSLDGGESTISNEKVSFKGKLSNGYKKGETVDMTQHIDKLFPYQAAKVQLGDRIIVSTAINPDTNQQEWNFVEHDKSIALAWLTILFFAAIILIGRGKGIATIVSLFFTGAVIFAVYIPSILSGQNIYVSTIVVSIFIILMSLLFINGANKKTLCAILGNLGGVLLAGLLALIMNRVLAVTGMVDQDYLYLLYLNEQSPIDLKAIVWGSIVIGSLGAIMDVSMSIASAMNELSDTMENKSMMKMVGSGMNIGRDAIGTMTNTLILAYIGGSLATC